MATKRKNTRANFGNVRALPSGRWQARYPDEHGAPMTGPETFGTAEEAWGHIADVRAARRRQAYTDHRKGERILTEYAREWIDNGGSRGHLSIKSRDLYLDLLAKQIAPSIGTTAIGKITPAMVRTWYTNTGRELAQRAAQPRADGASRVATGKARQRQAYALLKGILNTAVGDGLLGKNPCTISGAGTAKAPKRQFMSVEEFSQILMAHPQRLRAALLLAVTAHLRPSELVALQRRDLDIKAKTLYIGRQHVKPRGGAVVVTATKNGDERTLELPDIALDAITAYLATVPKAMPTMPLFVATDGRSPLTVQGLEQSWVKAREKVGLQQHTLYSTKHTGLTLAAQRGATMEELKQIAGHRTTAAASAYQLFAKERGRVIADNLDGALESLKALEM